MNFFHQRRPYLRSPPISGLTGCGDDTRLGIQHDEAEAGTLRLIQDPPFAIVIDERTVRSVGPHGRQRLGSDLAAVTTHPSIPRRYVDSLESAQIFDVHVVPAVLEHLDARGPYNGMLCTRVVRTPTERLGHTSAHDLDSG
jgi:hypothetical protein